MMAEAKPVSFRNECFRSAQLAGIIIQWTCHMIMHPGHAVDHIPKQKGLSRFIEMRNKLSDQIDIDRRRPASRPASLLPRLAA